MNDKNTKTLSQQPVKRRIPKLSDSEIDLIRCMKECGLSYMDIVRKFEGRVVKSTVRDIVNYKFR